MTILELAFLCPNFHASQIGAQLTRYDVHQARIHSGSSSLPSGFRTKTVPRDHQCPSIYKNVGISISPAMHLAFLLCSHFLLLIVLQSSLLSTAHSHSKFLTSHTRHLYLREINSWWVTFVKCTLTNKKVFESPHFLNKKFVISGAAHPLFSSTFCWKISLKM